VPLRAALMLSQASFHILALSVFETVQFLLCKVHAYTYTGVGTG
jgi:hypothetical protein